MEADTIERPKAKAAGETTRPRKRYRLTDLVAQMKDDNRRGEIQVGPARGREFGA